MTGESKPKDPTTPKKTKSFYHFAQLHEQYFKVSLDSSDATTEVKKAS